MNELQTKPYVLSLKKLEKEYEKVCDKLEQLNERAFELEKEIRRQK